jgi:hypothetical protein
MVAFLLSATIAAATCSFKFRLLAGLILNFLVVTAHTFFLMYYFDLSLMASR